MRNKVSALIVLVLLGLPISANALETDELIALTAMPLVVAAAAELTDVPTSELMSVVSTLNNAAVPPTQFVEVVRYAPVAIVAPTEPRFTTYVTTEYARGVTGEPLALAIADQYPAYGVEEIHIVDPPVVTYVERQTLLPEVVITRFEPQPFDPLALVAMPLAVAAVADITDVPAGDLISFITSLNRARVPAPQFVEIVRYSPVMLIDDVERPLFLRRVTTDIDRGVIGMPLAFSLADRIGIDEDINDIDFVRAPVVIEPVTTRVARAHPHGGPPGQLKKELGLQTGAEVVHGVKPGRSAKPSHAAARSRVVDDRDRHVRPARKPAKVRHGKKVDRDVVPVVRPSRGHEPKPHVMKQPHVSKGRGGGGHGNSGGGGGKGKGKGKG
jgi:hypothetical protein